MSCIKNLMSVTKAKCTTTDGGSGSDATAAGGGSSIDGASSPDIPLRTLKRKNNNGSGSGSGNSTTTAKRHKRGSTECYYSCGMQRDRTPLLLHFSPYGY